MVLTLRICYFNLISGVEGTLPTHSECSRGVRTCGDKKSAEVDLSRQKNIMKKVRQSLALWIALAALILSGINTYIIHYKSSIDVVAGKQIRLFVAHPDKIPQPCIFMSLSYINDGGKTVSVIDTKLKVKLKVKGTEVLASEFKSIREVDNFLYAEGHFEQSPVEPVVVLGKSVVVKQYTFVPYDLTEQEEIPASFDLEIGVYTRRFDEWQHHGTYVAENIAGVWQDLSEGPTFNATVIDIREML